MKVVFLTLGTITSSISYRPLALAKELIKRGYDVYLFAPRFDKYSDFKNETIEEIEGVKIIRPFQLRTFSFELGLVPYVISALFLLFKLKPDIIHIYKANPLTVCGVLLKYAQGKKIVFDTDDVDGEVMKIEGYSIFKVWLVGLSEAIVSSSADVIITGSRYLKQKYLSKYPNKIVRHIPNGAEFSEKICITDVKKLQRTIIFIGNINRSSILKPLFNILRKLKEKNIYPKIIIIGDGTYLKYFKKITQDFSLRNVIFTGRIPQNKLHNYVNPGDLGYSYMPNEVAQKACSNMKVFQYMQHGVIPIVSDVGDLPLYMFSGRAGYIVKHSNEEALTETILYALANKSDRIDKLTYIINNAEKVYTWSNLAKKVEKIYKEIL